MGWEIFTRQVVRTGEPMITLMASGRMSLNKPAGRRFEEKAIEHILLLWDKGERRVAVKPIGKKDARAYKLSYASKGNSAGFSAVTFFRHINYNWDETRSYPMTWNDEENMYIFTIPADHLTGSPRTYRNPQAPPKSKNRTIRHIGRQKEHAAAQITQ
jgi:hypothetical protein